MKHGIKTAALAVLALGLASGAQAALSAKPKDAAQSDRMVSNGYRLVAKDKSKAALKLFEKAVKLDKGNAQAWQALGDAFAAIGKDAKAQDAYEKGGVKAGGDNDAAAYQKAARYCGQAYGYLAKGNYTGAEHYFKAALQLAPAYTHAKAGLDEIAARGKAGDQGDANAAVSGDDKDDAGDKDDADAQDDDSKDAAKGAK